MLQWLLIVQRANVCDFRHECLSRTGRDRDHDRDCSPIVRQTKKNRLVSKALISSADQLCKYIVVSE